MMLNRRTSPRCGGWKLYGPVLVLLSVFVVAVLPGCGPSAGSPAGGGGHSTEPVADADTPVPPTAIGTDTPKSTTDNSGGAADSTSGTNPPGTDTPGPAVISPTPGDTAEPNPANTTTPDNAGANNVTTPLIPRKEFFGNPERARARLSPDGKKMAFLAPVEGVLNVWVCPTGDLASARPITKDRGRGVTAYFWAYTNEHVLYSKDNDGDEDFHVYCIDLATDKITDLTPIEKIAAQIEGVSEKFPQEILVGINDRGERQLHDIYRINIVTAERKLIQENPGFAGFISDDDFNVRFGVTFTPDAGQLILKPGGPDGWEDFLSIGPLDAMTTGIEGFDKSNKKVYFFDSRDRNTAALYLWDLETDKKELIAENDKADLSGAIVHPTEKTIQAVSFTYTRREWQILDESLRADLDYLATVNDGEVEITSRTLDDKLWTIAYLRDNGPVQFYLYDRAAKKATFLFTSNPSLEKLPLVKMHDLVVKARDGLPLVCYLTLPKESDPDGDARPDKPLPMVLNVHGGPWARDDWGYDPEHQLLANRGYAVMSVNYRGSTGFGKDFVNAGNKEWAAKMHDDLLDVVNWAVGQKIADPGRVGIMGGSYGGFATLVGVTFTPKFFACGVDIVGPSSLITLLENPPPYWMPFMPVMTYRVGDVNTEEGREFLKSRSPLFLADKIERPLLIGQGAQDPRVKKAEADQIVAAMEKHNIPVVYMLYPKEGHGFVRPENRFSFYAVTEAFLAKHLGGRAEPIGDAFEGAELEVPSGADQIPGLKEKLPAATP